MLENTFLATEVSTGGSQTNSNTILNCHKNSQDANQFKETMNKNRNLSLESDSTKTHQQFQIPKDSENIYVY